MSEQAGRSGSLGDRPVVVLTAGEALTMPVVSAEGNAAMRRVWLELHEELAGLSTNSDHRIVEGAGHYIHVDRPEAVVGAIGDVLGAVREGGVVGGELSVGRRVGGARERLSISRVPRDRPSGPRYDIDNLIPFHGPGQRTRGAGQEGGKGCRIVVWYECSVVLEAL